MCMQEEEGKTPEEDKGTEESEKVKDAFCLSLYISHRFRTNIESNEGGEDKVSSSTLLSSHHLQLFSLFRLISVSCHHGER